MKSLLFSLFLIPFTLIAQTNIDYSLLLKTGWSIQSSQKVSASGEEISTAAFKGKDWYPADIPSTVLAALVKNNVYKNVYIGENLKEIPKEQFQHSWWYRNEFTLSKEKNLTTVKLRCDGINYRANIWMNGHLVADTSSIFGAFRHFELDVTSFVAMGNKNVLAVEIFPPVAGDYTMGFVDWNPAPPDKNMGIWREMTIKMSGDVSIGFPFVQSNLDCENYKSARLTVSADVQNNSNKKITGVLEGKIESIGFSKSVDLEPNQIKTISFSADEYPQLNITNPRVWWTHDLGTPELYDLQLTFKTGNTISDESRTRFGIRKVEDYFNEQGYRGYKLNGKKILIRGGGWVDDMLLNNTHDNLNTQVQYAKQMNLNTLRFEGFWGSTQDIYNLCDENGILLMVGWSCQWEWESFLGKKDNRYGGVTNSNDRMLLSHMWQDQIKWLRNHPSIFVWLYGSDKYPEPELEKEYLTILSKDDPSRPSLASAANKTSAVSGKTGVKMNGPYDYVPPMYWYVDSLNGGAYGFNTETGPGPQIPVLESIKKFIPADHLWPIDSVWYFHCGGNKFKTLELYNIAMDHRLGKPENLDDYCMKAQYLNYEGMRAMFEAFVANKYKATGIIQWMYNAAWPKLWWQFYDYYLMPTAAFYGARKACEPVHILYNYGDGSVSVSNNTFSNVINGKATVKVFNIDHSEKFSTSVTVNIPADSSVKIVELQNIQGLSTAYFVDLRLYDAAGNLISSNFYCLSTKPDILDYAHNEWYVTPTKEYSDLTALNDLPAAELSSEYKLISEGEKMIVVATIYNVSKNLALGVTANLVNASTGETILPVYWDDNYIALLPGETRVVKGTLNAFLLKNATPTLRVEQWKGNGKK